MPTSTSGSFRTFTSTTISILKNSLVLFLFTFLLSNCSGGGDQQAAGGGAPEMPPMPVEVMVVAPTTISDEFNAVGSIEAVSSINVVAEIAAVVEEIPFREGSVVGRGTVLARLDDDQLLAQQQSAEAVVAQAKSTFSRVKGLAGMGGATPQDLDDAQAALQVAEANLSLVSARLEKTRIIAPFSGQTGMRQVNPGGYLKIGDIITTLTNIADLKVRFAVPERYFGQLKVGREVKVTTPAVPGVELTGKVSVVEPIVDAGTRNATVIAVVSNKDGQFRPGMSANITVTLASKENVITVPDEAVFGQGNQNFVYTVGPDGVTTLNPITTGIRTDRAVEILSGVSAGATVVTAGHQKIFFPGMKVMPLPPGGMAAMGAGGQGGPGGSPDGDQGTPGAADSSAMKTDSADGK